MKNEGHAHVWDVNGDIDEGWRPAVKEDYITKCMAVGPRDMPTPLWDTFLERVQPNKEVREFLYRFFGYCCTGHTHEQVFLFLWGPGQNGKGTFIETIRAIFGSYAAQASLLLLMRQKYPQHPEELAQLRGVRLVIADETDKGAEFDEAKMKHLISGERLRVRVMRGNSYEITPKFKIVVIGNNKPSFTDVGKAWRRRILLVPFDVTIPDEERNNKLKEDLVHEFPGILFKLLQGVKEWQRIGLAPPKVITDATDDYVAEEDLLAQFLEDEDLIAWQKGTPASERHINNKQAIDWTKYAHIGRLFGLLRPYATNAGEPAGSAKEMTRALKAKGFKYNRNLPLDPSNPSGKRGRGFHGLYIGQR